MGKKLFIAILIFITIGLVAIAEENSVLSLPKSLETIEEEAFMGISSAKEIIIPEGAKNIGPRAFAYCTFEEISLPSSLTSIGEEAFMYLSSAEELTLPEGLKTIGPRAFAYSELKQITLPSSLSSIGEETFMYLSSVKEMVLPNGIESIGAHAFAYSGFERIFLPASISSIADNAFEGCNNLTLEVISGSLAHDFCLKHGITADVKEPSTPTSNFRLGYSYHYNDDGEIVYTSVIISDYIGKDTIIKIPKYIDGIPVTEIGYSAFKDNTALRKIIIPDSITSISSFAFAGCTNLMEISFPAKLEDISDSAFEGCTSLRSVVFPEFTFTYEADNYRNGCLDIGEAAFRNCDSLESLSIRRNMHFEYASSYHTPSIILSDSCFEDCDNLKSVELSYTSTGRRTYLNNLSLRNSVFKNCNKLCSVALACSFNYGSSSSVFENCTSLSSFSSIGSFSPGDYAFKNCISLENPSANFYDIGAFSFEGCTNLHTISLNMTQIGESAFAGCANLTNLNYGNSGLSTGYNASSGYSIGKKAFAGCAKLTGTLNLNDISEICEGAFSECTGLEYVLLPNADTIIAEGAFEGCNFKAMVYTGSPAEEYMQANGIQHDVIMDKFVISCLDDSRCSIDRYYGSSLDIVIPERFGPYTVTKLGSNLFDENDCETLNTLTLPDTISELGWRPFDLNPFSFPLILHANSTTYETLNTFLQEEGFGSYNGFRSPSYPTLQLDKYFRDGIPYLNIVGYKGKDESVTIPCKIDGIVVRNIDTEGYAWDGVTDLFIESGVSTVSGILGRGPFSRCQTLENITYLGNVPEIDSYAFDQCPSLTSITVLGNVDKIGEYAFRDCTSLETVVFKGDVGSIGKKAFQECANLEIAIFNGDVGNIGEYAFNIGYLSSTPSKLHTVEFGGNINSIGRYAFYECGDLKNLSFNGDIGSIGEYAFYLCKSLDSLVLPTGNPTLGGNAFAGCNFRTITIPDGWTNLPAYIFSQSIAPDKVLIPNSVTSIAGTAFGYIYTRDETPVIYCNRYSYAHTWATDKDLPVVLMDGKDFADYGCIIVPESLRLPVDGEMKIEASVFPYDDSLTYLWNSSSPEIASVDQKGNIVGNAQGEAVISVSAGNVTSEIAVSTYLSLTDFILSSEELTIAAGSTARLSVESLIPAESLIHFRWSTTNDLMATVDETGLITAHSIGDVTITCAAENGLVRSCTIHIIAPT